jgi:hypothetical protein
MGEQPALLLLVQLHGVVDVNRAGRSETELEAHIEFNGMPHAEHKTGSKKAPVSASEGSLVALDYDHFSVFRVAPSEARRVKRRATLSVTLIEHNPFATVCRGEFELGTKPSVLGVPFQLVGRLAKPKDADDLNFDSSESSDDDDEAHDEHHHATVTATVMWLTLDHIEALSAGRDPAAAEGGESAIRLRHEGAGDAMTAASERADAEAASARAAAADELVEKLRADIVSMQRALDDERAMRSETAVRSPSSAVVELEELAEENEGLRGELAALKRGVALPSGDVSARAELEELAEENTGLRSELAALKQTLDRERDAHHAALQAHADAHAEVRSAAAAADEALVAERAAREAAVEHDSSAAREKAALKEQLARVHAAHAAESEAHAEARAAHSATRAAAQRAVQRAEAEAVERRKHAAALQKTLGEEHERHASTRAAASAASSADASAVETLRQQLDAVNVKCGHLAAGLKAATTELGATRGSLEEALAQRDLAVDRALRRRAEGSPQQVTLASLTRAAEADSLAERLVAAEAELVAVKSGGARGGARGGASGGASDTPAQVRFLLFTVTFYANHAHNLTRSP